MNTYKFKCKPTKGFREQYTCFTACCHSIIEESVAGIMRIML